MHIGEMGVASSVKGLYMYWSDRRQHVILTLTLCTDTHLLIVAATKACFMSKSCTKSIANM